MKNSRLKGMLWMLLICMSLLVSMYTQEQGTQLSSKTVNSQLVEDKKAILPDVDLVEKVIVKAKKLVRILKL